MKLLSSIRMGLAAKLAICVIASTAAFFALFGYLNLGMERRNSQDLVEQAAYRVTDVIVRSTHYEMLHNDRDALYNIIQELGTEPGIQRIRIYNKDGLISYASDGQEVQTAVDKSAEGCVGCHGQSDPLKTLTRPVQARYFADRQGHRVLGVMRPIDNAPECSNAACHVHQASQRILGVIDANLSLATVDAQLAQHQANLKWFLVSAILFRSQCCLPCPSGEPAHSGRDRRQPLPGHCRCPARAASGQSQVVPGECHPVPIAMLPAMSIRRASAFWA